MSTEPIQRVGFAKSSIHLLDKQVSTNKLPVFTLDSSCVIAYVEIYRDIHTLLYCFTLIPIQGLTYRDYYPYTLLLHSWVVLGLLSGRDYRV